MALAFQATFAKWLVGLEALSHQTRRSSWQRLHFRRSILALSFLALMFYFHFWNNFLYSSFLLQVCGMRRSRRWHSRFEAARWKKSTGKYVSRLSLAEMDTVVGTPFTWHEQTLLRRKSNEGETTEGDVSWDEELATRSTAVCLPWVYWSRHFSGGQQFFVILVGLCLAGLLLLSTELPRANFVACNKLCKWPNLQTRSPRARAKYSADAKILVILPGVERQTETLLNENRRQITLSGEFCVLLHDIF